MIQILPDREYTGSCLFDATEGTCVEDERCCSESARLAKCHWQLCFSLSHMPPPTVEASDTTRYFTLLNDDS